MAERPAKERRDDDRLYRLIAELDRLEDLLEEMEELGVASREDVASRMDALNAEIDALAPDGS